MKAFSAVSKGKELIDGYCDDKRKVITNVPIVLDGDHTKNVNILIFYL